MKVEDLVLDQKHIDDFLKRWEQFLKLLESEGDDLKNGTLFEKVAAYNRMYYFISHAKSLQEFQSLFIYLGHHCGTFDYADVDKITLDSHPIFEDIKSEDSNGKTLQSAMEDLFNILRGGR